ncbi:MAG: hypothetical protein EOO20_14200 [Chryseobacterium sp.]|nr:MAG: hypothetical protein EOO20_14200 [Chryseobacterium sp.]
MEFKHVGLFERYTAGHCTEEEKAVVEGWYLDRMKHDDARPSDRELCLAKSEIWEGIVAIAKFYDQT